MRSLSLSDPSIESALTVLCAAGGEGASVEILGYSPGLTPPQFQMVALVVLAVVVVMVAFTIVLLAPAGSPPSPPSPAPAQAHSPSTPVPTSAPFSAKNETVIADGEGTDTSSRTHALLDEETDRETSGDGP